MTDHNALNGVEMAFGVLEQLAARNAPVSITELATLLNTNKPRVHRHLQTLTALGYVRQDPDSARYFLTPKLHVMAANAPTVDDFLSAARAILPELRDALQMTVTIGRAGRRSVQVLDILRADTALQITTRPGAVFPLHSSAHGKVSLAFGGARLATVCADLDATDATALRAEIAQVQSQGWAVAPGAVLAGINALAVPVHQPGGDGLAGSIAILGAFESVPPQPDAELIARLQRAATNITESMTPSNRLAQ